jgi:Zn-dependent protease with chaperone function
MSVTAVDSHDHLVPVPAPISDNYLFFGYFVAMFVPYAIQLYTAMLDESSWPSLFVLYFGLILFAVCLFIVLGLFFELVSALTLSGRSASLLPHHTASAFFNALNEESEKLEINSRRLPEVYWAPSNYFMSARVFGGFRAKLLVTGGLCVAIAKGHPVARFILRHELAHLRNKDTRFYVLVLAACLLPLGVVVLSGATDFLFAVINVAAILLVSAFLLRRREFLADAIATNASDSRTTYAQFLDANASSESGWFHPSPESRLKALTRRSPVLSTSLGMLSLCIFLAVGATWRLQTIIYSASPHARFDLQSVAPRTFLFFLTVFPVLAFLFELAKGFGRKVPAEWAQVRARSFGIELIAALCLMNCWWWTITLGWRLPWEWLAKSAALPDEFYYQLRQGTIACAIIAISWLVAGLSLIFYKAWGRYFSICLGSASILWMIVECTHKNRFAWFGWYEPVWGMDIPAAFAVWALTTGTALWVVVALSQRRIKATFPLGKLGRGRIIGFTIATVVAASLATVTVSALKVQPTVDEFEHQAQIAREKLAPPLMPLPTLGDGTHRVQLKEEEAERLLVSQPSSTDVDGDELRGKEALVWLLVGRDGKVEDVKVIDGPSFADVIAKVKNRQYRPLLLNSEPVEFETKIHAHL